MDLKWLAGNNLSFEEILKLARIDNAIPAEYDLTWISTEAEVAARAEMLLKGLATDFFQVAKFKDEIVGFHVISAGKDSVARISTLWVHPDHRGQGIGRQLKDAGKAWAKASGYEYLQTAVHSANRRMHEINISTGFEPFSTIYRMKL